MSWILFPHANCFLHKKQRWELEHLFPITIIKLSFLIFRVQLAHFPASKAHFPIFSAGSHAHFLAYPLGCDAHFSPLSSGRVTHFPSFPSEINGHLQSFPSGIYTDFPSFSSGFNTFFHSDWPFAHFPFWLAFCPFPSIPLWLTSLLLLWSVNWKLRLSVADEGVEGGRSSLGVGMLEWGRTWKKHIRYIIMDFLSGVFTLTSKTQHLSASFQTNDQWKNYSIQNDSSD